MIFTPKRYGPTAYAVGPIILYKMHAKCGKRNCQFRKVQWVIEGPTNVGPTSDVLPTELPRGRKCGVRMRV